MGMLTDSLRILAAIVRARLAGFRAQEPAPPFPDIVLTDDGSPLFQFILTHQLAPEAFMLLFLALAPHLQPGFLDQLIREHLPEGGEFPEFGGVRGAAHRGLLPTGETALFILAGTDLDQRLALVALFSPDQFFTRQKILTLAEVPPGEPRLSGRLVLDSDYVELFTTGRVAAPTLSPGFPAQRISTALEWADLVLPAATRAQIQDLEHWVQHHAALGTDWGLGRRLRPGYRALFYGPPGTGKTMTATLLGKYTGREVFRVDLSLVSSKYIGETEKNLGGLFDRAQAKGWILFFDEADALFGKRTETRDAHDRYANQEVAFLLQKIEEYDGLVLLASNLRGNLDPAFARRFQAMIHFPLPNAEERRQLWASTLPPPARRAPDVCPDDLAARYELSGAAILNAVQFAALRALGRQHTALILADLTEAVRLEFQKEGRLL